MKIIRQLPAYLLTAYNRLVGIIHNPVVRPVYQCALYCERQGVHRSGGGDDNAALAYFNARYSEHAKRLWTEGKNMDADSLGRFVISRWS